jgi:hypothetical protein
MRPIIIREKIFKFGMMQTRAPPKKRVLFKFAFAFGAFASVLHVYKHYQTV